MNRKVYLNLPQIGRDSGNEVNYRCPLCQKPKLYWNTVTHLGTCFSCDRGYNIKSITRITTLNWMKSFAEDMNISLEPPAPVEVRYNFEPVRSNRDDQLEARAFLLAEKKLMPNIIYDQLYYSVPTREIGVPLHSCFGLEQVTWMRRSIDRKGWFIDAGTDKSSYLYYAPCRIKPPLPNGGEILYLVEGVFDALSLSPFCSAISLLGTTLYDAQAVTIKKKLEVSNNKLPIFIWMDPDKAGQRAATKILFQLRYEMGINAQVVMSNHEPNDLDPDVLCSVVASGVESLIGNYRNHTYDENRKMRN